MIPESMLLWGVSVILAIQSFSSPLLDDIVRAINAMGSAELYIVVLSALYWCVNRQAAVQVAPIFILADYAARVLKDITGVPRPYDLDARVRNLDPQTDLSFPSAAVQAAAAFWLTLAHSYRRAWLWALAAAMIVLIALARMYLGAHYPTDVIGSVVIALVLIVLLVRVDFAGLAVRAITGRGRLLLLVPPALAAIHLGSETATDMGVLLGFLVGVGIVERHVPFETSGRAWQQLTRLVLGLSVAFGIRVALKVVLPEGAWFELARFSVLGLWVAAAAPWVFVRTGLASLESRPSIAAAPVIGSTRLQAP